MKFSIIRDIGTDTDLLCVIAGVSRSGYYKWLKRVGEPEKDFNDYVLIKELFDKGKGKYGWRTIQMKLKSAFGIVMNHKKIIRIKNKYRLFTSIRRNSRNRMILKRSVEHTVFRNVLNRNFRQPIPRKAFCTDITFLRFRNRMVYLSAVKDIASREIVAWQLSRNLSTNVSLDTIEDMKLNQPIASLKDVLIHSDQGSHYTNAEYVRKIKELHMVQSMSRKGNAVDNAPMESFFGHFKDEVDYGSCKTFEEVKMVTRKYIDYYNNERQQWNLKKMTPVEYRNHLLSQR